MKKKKAVEMKESVVAARGRLREQADRDLAFREYVAAKWQADRLWAIWMERAGYLNVPNLAG